MPRHEGGDVAAGFCHVIERAGSGPEPGGDFSWARPNEFHALTINGPFFSQNKNKNKNGGIR